MADTISILERLKPINLDAGSVFSGKPSGTSVVGFAKPSVFTPAKDQSYIFHDESRDVAVWFLDQNDPLYVFGPQGSGKTSLVKQIAAMLNYPVFEVTGHNRLEFPELVGHLIVKDGQMSFEYGPLSLAMKYGGLFLLNEIDILDPSTAAGLNGVLDGSPLCVPENNGELIVQHPMFKFVATGNTNGTSDETGLYQGTLRQNSAFMDRFWLVEIGYPKPESEEKLLAKTAPTLPPELRSKMVSYANEVRKLFMANLSKGSETALEVTFSTRTLIRWANLTVKFQPLAWQGLSPINHSLDRAMAFRAIPESRVFLHELLQRFFASDIAPKSNTQK
ncbi:MAG: CbbQ/NirQ/NorQ/GpvN family protein [Deltaproteobacteria bacterium]|jgi:cobaltochelatase CobS|nr:CbbQ/NirQ/NorQ/GpvN family protein [Deltaproteobacteria bacterium]